MEDFEADLSALKIKRGALLEQLKKGEGDRENLKAELERIDVQIAVLEDAIENDKVRHYRLPIFVLAWPRSSEPSRRRSAQCRRRRSARGGRDLRNHNAPHAY
jgi:hypothetical protein